MKFEAGNEKMQNSTMLEILTDFEAGKLDTRFQY